MLKALGFIFGGFGLSISGFYVFFTSIQSFAAQKGGWLIILAPFLIGIGIFLLMRGSHARASFELNLSDNKDTSAFDSKLQKNNAFMAEWNKTNETKDKLKTLQYQAASELEEEQNKVNS